MKVAFAVTGLGFAGGIRAIVEIANRLYNKGYNVSIVSLSKDNFWSNVKVPIYYAKIPNISIPLQIAVKSYRLFKHFNLKGIESYSDIMMLAKKLGIRADSIQPLAETIIDLNPDVGIATWYPTAFSVWMSGVERPLFFMQDFKELVEEVEGNYGIKMFESTLRLKFHFLANSTFTRDLILSYNKDAKVTITGVGVDHNVFHPRKENSIVNSKNKPVIMAVIRGQKFKRGDIAIKALNLINREKPIHAVLVGEDQAIDKLLREIKPEFTYTKFPHVDDETLAKLYSSSEAFIFTSYKEGFGLPPLEAMASGTAVITTDCGGNRDYTIDGYNSLVVPPDDPLAIAKATLKVLNDTKLREKLVEGGLETAKMWTWDKVINKFEDAIKGES
ncbi:MAG: glycosyltransferase family 4 protein [Candidatus Nanopusillus sp.]